MTKLRHVLVTILWVSLVPSRGAAQPLTAGTVALLVEDRTAGDATLRAALEDARPEIRGMAARVIGVNSRVSLYDSISAALQREQDPAAAAELIRAALFLRGVAAVEPATQAASRLGGASLLPLAEWLARSDGERFIASLPLLAGAPDRLKRSVGNLAAMAVARSGTDRERLTAAMSASSSGVSWRTFLDKAQWSTGRGAAIKAGLSASSSEVRQETLWWTLAAVVRGELPPEVAFEAVSAVSAEGEDEWSAAARQLLARRARAQQPADLGILFEKRGPTRRADLIAISTMAELTEGERAALARILGAQFQSKPPAGPPAPRITALRLVEMPFPGVLKDLIAAAGCKRSGTDAFGAARLTYQDDGRARQIGIDAGTLPPECARVVRVAALLTTMVIDEPVVADAFQWLYVPMLTDVVACIDSPIVETEIRSISGKIQAPKKTKNVNPIYPAALQKARVQGLVILEAVITAQGCVRRANVIRSEHPGLDVAAMHAVTQWRFSPTLVEGTAVPVIMTVTVNFTLQ